MRRSSLAVAVVSLGVLVLGGHLLIRRLRPAPARPVADLPPSPPRVGPVSSPARPSASADVPSAALRVSRRTAGGAVVSELARLRGSVVFPVDAPSDRHPPLKVQADDGENTFLAKVDAEGRFDIRLPSRTYSLTASAGLLAGAVDDVRAVAGETTDGIVVRLQGEAVIEGKVHLPGADPKDEPDVSAVRSGTGIDSGESSVEDDGRFLVSGLVAGRRYDLQVEARGFRPAKVTALAAPAGPVEVTLERLPRLHGAVGLSEDGTCPVDHIVVRDVDEEAIDESCRFDVRGLPPGEEVQVAVSGPGLHLEARVPVPERGDPEPLCLNPPCSDKPVPERATLAVQLADAGERGGVFASVDHGANGGRGCGASGDRCELADLPAGVPVDLVVSSAGCEQTVQKVTLRPGNNSVVVPCRRMREVQGVVRLSSGASAPAPPDLLVRCGENSSSRTRGRFIFTLRCPAGASALEWRTEGHPGWRRVALAVGADPAFVEIPLP